MKVAQKSLCIFIHYSQHAHLPIYVSIYVNELSNYFDRVILVTNQSLSKPGLLNLRKNVSTLQVQNEGYDLGMFFKVFHSIDPSEFSQIACINDSNILFNQLHPIFTWSKKIEYDFWGLIDSHEKPWFSTHTNNYHIQSHFIVFNRKAIEQLPAFFNALQIQEIYDEKDAAKLRQMVINKWEIGLSQFFINEGLSNGSYIDSRSYSNLHLSGKMANIGHKLYPELIQSGYPLIKKKIITNGSWKDIFRSGTHWKNMMRQYGNRDWEIETLIEELIQIKNKSVNQSINKKKKKFWDGYSFLQKTDIA